MTAADKRGSKTMYQYGFLDQYAKREIRRCCLKAVAIPGYQVPYSSREMPMARGFGTGGLQLTLSLVGPEDTVKVISGRELLAQVRDQDSRVSHIAEMLFRIGDVRVRQAAFHPGGGQRVLSLSPQVFAVLRTSPDQSDHILCLTNVANRECRLDLNLSEMGVLANEWRDLTSGRDLRARGGRLKIGLQPYDVAWLMPADELNDSVV